MKKDFFTVFRFSWLLLVAVLAMPLLSYGQAPTLVCNDNVQISLAAPISPIAGGEAWCGLVTPDAFLEDTPDGVYFLAIGGSTYRASSATSNFILWDVAKNLPVLDAAGRLIIDFQKFDGQTVKYTISTGGNSCWGEATIELNVIAELELGCPYVPAIHQEKTVTIAAGQTMAMFTVGSTPDMCQAITVTASGSAKYACPEGDDGELGTLDDGWCTIACSATYDAAANKVIVTIPTDIPVDVDCKIVVTAPECIECVSWCPGEELDEADIEKALSGSCFASPEKIFKNVTEHGDQCEGLTRIIKYSALINQHGQSILVDIGTQAFKLEPISIFATNPATGLLECNIYNDGSDPAVTFPATGSGVLCLPSTNVSLNCDQDPNDWALTGQPTLKNHHEETKATACTAPLTIHYKEVVGIKKDQPVQVGDDWIIVDILEKEFKEVTVCTCADIQPILDRYVANHAKVGDVVEIVNGATGADAFLDLAKLECDDDILVPITHTTVTLPYKEYTLDEIAEFACNTILYTVSDAGEFPACGSGRKFLRNWTLIDWCLGKRKEFTQVIEVKDTKSPVILKSEFDKETVSTQAWVCTGAIEADEASAKQYFSDECSDFRVEIEVVQAESGAVVDAGSVGVGHYIVSYVAVDDCGNKTKAVTREYSVVDNVKPVPVCEDELVVSVTVDNSADGDGGLAKIYAADFDANSHDAGCGPIAKFEVVRMEDWNVAPVTCDPFTEEVKEVVVIDKFGTTEETVTEIGVFGEFVKFCCEDVDNDNIVVLRVHDAAGNFNDCMVRVSVQNKLGAALACIDHTVKCTEYTGNHEDYAGFDTAGSKCVSQDVTLFDVADSVNSCGKGSITRFYVLDGTNAICQSTITLTGDGAFNPMTIRWPFHYDDNVYTAITKEIDTRAGSSTEGMCIETGTEEVSLGTLNCGDDQPVCEPTWEDTACGLVGVSVKEEIIAFDADACYKVIKRWTVVDWCTWEANDGSENLDDENDTDRDVFEACANWCEEDCDRYFFRYADGQFDEDGYYTFDQVIKVVDDVAPTVTCTATGTGIGADCIGDISFSASATDGAGCPSETISYSWTITDAAGGTVKSGTGASGEMKNLTAGVYTVTFVAGDGCGNSGSTSCEVELKDEKAPTPYCYQSLSTAVMAGDEPMVEIWASDYLQKGEDNCTAEEDLIASFSGTEAVTNARFTCADVTGRDIEMKVWLWDAAGNADYCFVTIRVDDNGHCEADGSSAMIAGNIATEYGDNVAEAEVMLNSTHPEFPAMRTTQNDGHYAFASTPLTYDYEISAERNDDYMNGVSTLDLVLIQKHILGTTVLDSPYKVIAADINSDQDVTGADLVQLRQLILGITAELPANDSWRFVDGAQSFASSTSPWPFTESLDVVGLSNNMMAEDFVGVKIGDVNSTSQANSFVNAEVRSSGTLNLIMADAAVRAGDVLSVNVTADNFSEVYGYQLTMNHAGLTLESVEAGAIDLTDANIGVRQGVLTMSWNNTDGVTSSDVLFTLNFNASKDLQLSNTISINSRITSAEAYVGSELANNDIALTFTNGENTIAAAEYSLYQNEPNPFGTFTDVSFVLPTSGNATITVLDVTGKVVRTVQDQFSKGLNTVRFTKSELGAASGILYYQLESGEFTATKKMIVIE